MDDSITYVYQFYRGVSGESGQRHISFYHLISQQLIEEEQLNTITSRYKGWEVLALKPVDGEDISNKLNGLGIYHDEEVIEGKCLRALVKYGVIPTENIVPEESSFVYGSP